MNIVFCNVCLTNLFISKLKLNSIEKIYRQCVSIKCIQYVVPMTCYVLSYKNLLKDLFQN